MTTTGLCSDEPTRSKASPHRHAYNLLSLALDNDGLAAETSLAVSHARARIRVLTTTDNLTVEDRAALCVEASDWLDRAMNTTTAYGDRGLLEDAKQSLNDGERA